MKPRSAAKYLEICAFPQAGRIRRSLLLIIGACAAGLGLYGLAGFYGGPWLVDRWLAQYRTAAPGRTTARETVRFNPFTLVGEIVGLDIRDADVDATFRADTLLVDFTARSLSERRPVISSIVIERPRANFASFADLTVLARRARGTLPDRARIERLDVHAGEIIAGAGAEPAVAFAALELSLTAYDEQAGNPARFSFNARTAAAAGVSLTGTLAADLTGAEGQLRASTLGLDAIANHLGGVIDAAQPRGRIDLSAAFSATALLSEPTLALTDASLDFAELSLTPAPGLSVTADRVTATADLTLSATDDGVAIGGRIESSGAPLLIRDSRVTPPQSFTFEDAVFLATANADADGASVLLRGDLVSAGAATLTVNIPGAAETRRVSIEAADVPAAMISAYAARALGRHLAAGSTDLRLEYSLNRNRAAGSLHVTARDLGFAARTLGGATAADSQSLELAAALLENSAGIIELDLRFAGNTGSVGAALADALTARIGAVTEAPFGTLAAVVEGAAQTNNAVPFLPGDAALNDRALATVAALADALKARPRLGMRVYAAHDATVDRTALARQQIELHVQLATAGPGRQARPAAVDFDSPRARDVLDEFAGERLAPERVTALAERFECEGALASLCQRSFYEQVFDALVANEEIGPTALSRLGRFRAQSILDALRQRGIAGERIELVTGGTRDVIETPFGVGLPVELTALDTPP